MIRSVVLKFLVTWIGVFISLDSFARVQVTATVDRNSVQEGDFILYSIRVTAKNQTVQVGDPRLPDLEGFDLVSKNESMESRHEFVNGEIQALVTQSYNYTLVAPKRGQFKLAPAEVIVDGKTFSTLPITITVAAGGGPRPRPQRPQQDPMADPMDDVDDQFTQLLRRQILGMQRRGDPRGEQPARPLNEKEAFLLDVAVDKKEAFVGEQVTVTYYLYTRHLVRDIDPLKYPTLKGFWKEDIEIPTRLNYEEVVVNGVPYRRALLASYAVFPLKPGVISIDSYKAKCTVVMSNSALGLFGMGNVYQFTKASPEFRLQVKALPTAGLPKSFSGAVGEFDVSASVPGGQKFQVGQPFSYKIRIEGRGNAKTIEPPAVEYPSSVEIFDTKSDSKFFKDGRSFKEFEVLVIPRANGPLKLPAVAIGVFDPKSQRYVEKTTQPIEVMIAGGAPGEVISGRKMELPETKRERKLVLPPPVISLGWDLPFSKQTRFQFWILLILFILAGFVGLDLLNARRAGSSSTMMRTLDAKVKKLRLLSSQGEYRKLGAQGLNLISMVLGVAGGQEGLSPQQITLAIEGLPPSVREVVSTRLSSIAQKLETLGFAPEAMIGELSKKEVQSKLLDELAGTCAELIRAVELEEKAVTSKTASV